MLFVLFDLFFSFVLQEAMNNVERSLVVLLLECPKMIVRIYVDPGFILTCACHVKGLLGAYYAELSYYVR